MNNKVVVSNEYKFIRCLGEGLSSTVYEATRSNSSGMSCEQVAVKVLKSENSVSWLQNEFESLRKVNSPNCVRVLGHESFAEGPALVLEFINGVSLFELGSEFELSEDEIGEIASQAMRGLTDIASAGFAHGDLNPKNILINREGVVKLIDFGSFRESSEIIGSVPYMSNRIWNGEDPSLESDIESLAIVLSDVRTQFKNVPTSLSEAKNRSSIPRSFSQEPSNRSRKLLGKKVSDQLQRQIPHIETAVFSRKSAPNPGRKAAWMMILVGSVFFPAQTLLSTPIKQAEPALIHVRTLQWTQIKINGVSRGYAPLNLNGLQPGAYKLQYERQSGKGEILVYLNPGRKVVLKDADFN
jgi:serine/threonine protein kinase